jgi:NAD(P)-dependent dehydrogenase (short-subunit alcohol dehydrogenase family)
MDDNLPDVVLVTGGNRGLGRAIVERLHADGYLVSVGARDLSDLGWLSAGPSILKCRIDLCDRESIRRWAEDTVAAFGRIDAIVNNAGFSAACSLDDDDEDGLDMMWEINAKGPLRLARACWPYLKQSGHGRIVTISSLSGVRVQSADTGGYAMTKHAAVALTHALRFAGWDDGIRTTNICPGLIATDMSLGVDTLPREQMSQPEDIAGVVSHILSLPNNASVTTVPVNSVLETNY